MLGKEFAAQTYEYFRKNQTPQNWNDRWAHECYDIHMSLNAGMRFPTLLVLLGLAVPVFGAEQSAAYLVDTCFVSNPNTAICEGAPTPSTSSPMPTSRS